jgi:hypothetical protein
MRWPGFFSLSFCGEREARGTDISAEEVVSEPPAAGGIFENLFYVRSEV